MALKKICSILLCFFMLTSDLARADPGLSFIHKFVRPESQLPVFELPEALGRIEKIYRPRDVKPGAPFVIYLQTMHGHPEAARRIRKITNYLQRRYGMKLVLAEGASAKLHPEFLSFFKDPKQNRRALHALTEQGLLTGADLALLNPEIQGAGVETPEAYREAYEQYQKVMGRRAESLAWIEREKATLDLNASKEFSPETREMLQAWLQFKHNTRDFRATVNFLQQTALKKISADFDNAFAQFEWPQLSRVAVLLELEKRRDDAAFKAEYSKLKIWLDTKKLDGHWLDLLAQAASVPEKRKAITRAGAETFLKQVWPQGFSMRDYPQTAYAVATLVLEKELDGVQLTQELSRIFDKLLKALLTCKEERALLAEYKHLLLVEKLLTLELTPQEWAEFKKKDVFVIARSFAVLGRTTRQSKNTGIASSSQSGSSSSGVPKPFLVMTNPSDRPPAYADALKFYRSMNAREKAFLENLTKASTEAKASSVVLITGGFHARGMTRELRKNKIPYALITPRISASVDPAVYRKSMFATAHLERSLATQPAAFANRQGWPVRKEAASVRQILSEAFPGQSELRHAPYFKDRRTTLTTPLAARDARHSGAMQSGAQAKSEVRTKAEMPLMWASVFSALTSKYNILHLLQGGPVQMPGWFTAFEPKIPASVSITSHSSDSALFSNPADIRSFEDVARDIASGKIKTPLVYKPTHGELGKGIFFIERDAQENWVLTMAWTESLLASDNRASERVKTYLESSGIVPRTSPDREQDIIQYKFRPDQDIAAILTGVWQAVSTDVEWSRYDAGMMSQAEPALVKTNRRKIIETRYAFEGHLLQDSIEWIKTETAQGFDTFTRTGSSAYFSNFAGRPAARIDWYEDMYQPLMNALHISEDRIPEFKAYMQGIIQAEWSYLNQRLRESGLKESVEVQAAFDLAWLLPTPESHGFPVPYLIEVSVIPQDIEDISRPVGGSFQKRSEAGRSEMRLPRMVIADDFTGALNIATSRRNAAGLGAIVVDDFNMVTGGHIPDQRLVVMDMKAATFNETRAYERNAQLASIFNAQGILPDLKVDYALRNLRHALAGFIDQLNYDLAIFVPAMPSLGSKTLGGRLWVTQAGSLMPVHTSTLASQSRRPITTSEIIPFLHEELGLESAKILWVPLNIIHTGAQGIIDFIRSKHPAPGTVLVPDIASSENILAVTEAIQTLELEGLEGQPKKIFRMGSSEFLRALSGVDLAAGTDFELKPREIRGAPVALIGTINHETTLQVQAAVTQLGEGVRVFELDLEKTLAGGLASLVYTLALRNQISAALVQGQAVILQTPRDMRAFDYDQAVAATRALATVFDSEVLLGKVTGIFISGAETSGAFTEKLLARGVIAEGQFSVNAPAGRIYGGRANGVPVVVKAGGNASDRNVIAKFLRQMSTRSEVRSLESPTRQTFSYRDLETQWVAMKSAPGFIYDTLIVGGGAAGAGVLRDLALRGNISALLVEKGDFAGATSSKSGKSIHPGLWYLRMAWHDLLVAFHLRKDPKRISFRHSLESSWDNLKLVLGGTRERGIMVETTGGTVEPLSHTALIYRDSPDAKWQTILGIRVYGLFSWVLRSSYGKAKVYWTAEQVLRDLPFVSTAGLVGAVRYWDAKANNDKTLVLETIRDAYYRSTSEVPIRALSRVEVKDYAWVPAATQELPGNFRVTLIKHFGAQTEELTVSARTLTNAAGAWIDEVNQRARKDEASKKIVTFGGGSQIEATNQFIQDQLSHAEGREALRTALAPLLKTRRYFFRWYRHNGLWFLRLGSTDRKDKTPENMHPDKSEIKELVEAYNSIVGDPRWKITAADIYHADSGIRPLVRPEADSKALGDLSRFFDIKETRVDEGIVYNMIGVKLTEMRWAGEALGEKLARELKRLGVKEAGKSTTRTTSFRQVADEMIYRLQSAGYARDENFLKYRLTHLVDYQMLTGFRDYMMHQGGQRDALEFNEQGKPEISQTRARFLLKTLGDLLNWDTAQREAEWNQYQEMHERNMAAVYAWAAKSEMRTTNHLGEIDQGIQILKDRFLSVGGFEKTRQSLVENSYKLPQQIAAEMGFFASLLDRQSVEGEPLTGLWQKFTQEFQTFLTKKHIEWIIGSAGKVNTKEVARGRTDQVAIEGLFFAELSAVVFALHAELISGTPAAEVGERLLELNRLLAEDHTRGVNGLTRIAGSLPEFEVILTSLTADYSEGTPPNTVPTLEEKQLLAIGLAEQAWPPALRDSMLPLKVVHKVNHLELASFFGLKGEDFSAPSLGNWYIGNNWIDFAELTALLEPVTEMANAGNQEAEQALGRLMRFLPEIFFQDRRFWIAKLQAYFKQAETLRTGQPELYARIFDQITAPAVAPLELHENRNFFLALNMMRFARDEGSVPARLNDALWQTEQGRRWFDQPQARERSLTDPFEVYANAFKSSQTMPARQRQLERLRAIHDHPDVPFAGDLDGREQERVLRMTAEFLKRTDGFLTRVGAAGLLGVGDEVISLSARSGRLAAKQVTPSVIPQSAAQPWNLTDAPILETMDRIWPKGIKGQRKYEGNKTKIAAAIAEASAKAPLTVQELTGIFQGHGVNVKDVSGLLGKLRTLAELKVRSEMRNEAEQPGELPKDAGEAAGDFAPQDAKVTSQDARFIAVLELMREGREIPADMQRLTPRVSSTHGEIQIATVTYTVGSKVVKKSIAPVSHSEFKNSEVTAIIRKTGPGTSGMGEYSIGLEVTSKASGKKFMFVSYILAKDGRLRVGKLEKTNMEYDGRLALESVPTGAAALNKEIIYGIVHNQMPEKFRTMNIDTLRELGLITQKETAIYFWKPDTRLDLPDNLSVDRLVVRLDPVEMPVVNEVSQGGATIETAWVASLWIDEEKDLDGSVIRPALPLLDIVLYRPSVGFTVTRPHPRGRTGYQHVQGPIPDVKHTFKDLIKAHWNTYWLANGGIHPPADEIDVSSAHGIQTDPYVFNLQGKTIALELGPEFSKGDTLRAWVSFGENRRGLKYTNSASGAEKYFMIYDNNQFYEPYEIKKPDQVTEAAGPASAAKEKIVDIHEDFHPSLSLEEKLLLIKERQRIWQAMEGLEKEWQAALRLAPKAKLQKLKALQGEYEKLFQEAHALTLVQTQADYSSSPALAEKLHYTRTLEYKGVEPRRDEASVQIFRELMATVVSGRPSGDTFKQLTRNFGLVNEVLRVVELPVRNRKIFAAGDGDTAHAVPLGSYVKDRIYVSVSMEQHQSQTVVRLRLYDPDHMNEPWDSLYFDPNRGSFIFSRDEWIEFFEDSEIHTAPGDMIAAHITEQGRLNLFRDIDVTIAPAYSKKAFGFVNLGDALYEGMEHQDFYPFRTKGNGRRYYLKAQVIDGQKWVRVYGSPAMDEASELGSFRWLGDDENWRSRAEEGGIGFSEAQSGPLAEYRGYSFRDRLWTALKRWAGGAPGEPHFHELALRDEIGTRNKVDLPVPEDVQKENPAHLSVRQGHGEKGDAVFWRTAPEEISARALDLYDKRGIFQERAFYSPEAPEGANTLTEASRRFLVLRGLVQAGRDELPGPVLLSRPGSAKMERFEVLDTARGAVAKRRGTNVILNLFKEMENAGLPESFHGSMMWLEYGTIVEEGQTRPVLYATAVNLEQKKAYLAVRAVETTEGQFRYDLLRGGQDVSAQVMPRLQELGYDRGVDSVVFPAYLKRRLDAINREIQLLQAPHQGLEGLQQFAAKGFVANLLEAARFSSFSPIRAELYFYLTSDSFRLALTESARQLTEAYAMRSSDADFLKSDGVLHFVAELLNQPGLEGFTRHEAWRFEPIEQLHQQIMNLRSVNSSDFSAQDRAEAVVQLARGILSGEQFGAANQIEVSVPDYVRPPKTAAAASAPVRRTEWVPIPEMKAVLVSMPGIQARPPRVEVTEKPPTEEPEPLGFKAVLKIGQLVRVSWPESFTALDRRLYFGVPSESTFLRRIARLEELQRGYAQLREALPKPESPAAVTEPDLAATWAEYRRALSRKPRPESVLIRRPVYYGWPALEDLPAPQREFEERLRQTILAIQAEEPQMEYFWVEMGPVLRSGREWSPAFYVTGVNFRAGQVSRIRRVSVDHRNRFYTTVSGDQTGSVFSHPIFGAILEHGYQFYGEPDKIGVLIDKRLAQVRKMRELEQIDWGENPALESFLAIPDLLNSLAQSRFAAGSDSLLLNPPKDFQNGMSALEINFYPRTRPLQLFFAVARKIAAESEPPSKEEALRFLRLIESSDSREMWALLGYQKFMLMPFSRLHFRIERSEAESAAKELEDTRRIAQYFENMRQKHFSSLVLPSTEVRPAMVEIPEPEPEKDEEPVTEGLVPLAIPSTTEMTLPMEISTEVSQMASPAAEPAKVPEKTEPTAEAKEAVRVALEASLNSFYEKLDAWIALFNDGQNDPLQEEATSFLEKVPDEEDMEYQSVRDRFDYYLMMSRLLYFTGFDRADSIQSFEAAKVLLSQIADDWSLQNYQAWKDYLMPEDEAGPDDSPAAVAEPQRPAEVSPPAAPAVDPARELQERITAINARLLKAKDMVALRKGIDELKQIAPTDWTTRKWGFYAEVLKDIFAMQDEIDRDTAIRFDNYRGRIPRIGRDIDKFFREYHDPKMAEGLRSALAGVESAFNFTRWSQELTWMEKDLKKRPTPLDEVQKRLDELIKSKALIVTANRISPDADHELNVHILAIQRRIDAARAEVRDASARRPARRFVPPARAEMRDASTRRPTSRFVPPARAEMRVSPKTEALIERISNLFSIRPEEWAAVPANQRDFKPRTVSSADDLEKSSRLAQEIAALPREEQDELIRGLEGIGYFIRQGAVKIFKEAGAAMVPALTDALDSDDFQIQALAAEALGEIGEPAKNAASRLFGLLTHSSAMVQDAAATALPAIGADPALAIPRMADLYFYVKKREIEWVRSNVVAALRRYGFAAALVFTEMLKRSKKPERILNMIELISLMNWDGRAALDELQRIVRETDNDEVRNAAAGLIQRIKEKDPALLDEKDVAVAGISVLETQRISFDVVTDVTGAGYEVVKLQANDLRKQLGLAMSSAAEAVLVYWIPGLGDNRPLFLIVTEGNVEAIYRVDSEFSGLASPERFYEDFRLRWEPQDQTIDDNDTLISFANFSGRVVNIEGEPRKGNQLNLTLRVSQPGSRSEVRTPQVAVAASEDHFIDRAQVQQWEARLQTAVEESVRAGKRTYAYPVSLPALVEYRRMLEAILSQADVPNHPGKIYLSGFGLDLSDPQKTAGESPLAFLFKSGNPLQMFEARFVKIKSKKFPSYAGDGAFIQGDDAVFLLTGELIKPDGTSATAGDYQKLGWEFVKDTAGQDVTFPLFMTYLFPTRKATLPIGFSQMGVLRDGDALRVLATAEDYEKAITDKFSDEGQSFLQSLKGRAQALVDENNQREFQSWLTPQDELYQEMLAAATVTVMRSFLVEKGLGDFLPISAIQQKGGGAPYFIQAKTDAAAHTEGFEPTQREVSAPGKINGGALRFYVDSRYEGKTGIVLANYQGSGVAPGGAYEEKEAVRLDAELLKHSARLSAVTVGAVEIISEAQLTALGVQERLKPLYVSTRVVVDDTRALSDLFNPAMYENFLKTEVRHAMNAGAEAGAFDLKKAAYYHLQSLAQNMAVNIAAMLKTGYVIKNEDADTNPDRGFIRNISPWGLLRDSGGLKKIEMPQEATILIKAMFDGLFAIARLAGISRQEFIESEAFDDLIQTFVDKTGKGAGDGDSSAGDAKVLRDIGRVKQAMLDHWNDQPPQVFPDEKLFTEDLRDSKAYHTLTGIIFLLANHWYTAADIFGQLTNDEFAFQSYIAPYDADLGMLAGVGTSQEPFVVGRQFGATKVSVYFQPHVNVTGQSPAQTIGNIRANQVVLPAVQKILDARLAEKFQPDAQGFTRISTKEYAQAVDESVRESLDIFKAQPHSVISTTFGALQAVEPMAEAYGSIPAVAFLLLGYKKDWPTLEKDIALLLLTLDTYFSQRSPMQAFKIVVRDREVYETLLKFMITYPSLLGDSPLAKDLADQPLKAPEDESYLGKYAKGAWGTDGSREKALWKWFGEDEGALMAWLQNEAPIQEVAMAVHFIELNLQDARTQAQVSADDLQSLHALLKPLYDHFTWSDAAFNDDALFSRERQFLAMQMSGIAAARVGEGHAADAQRMYAAFAKTPRHLFLPRFAYRRAYEDEPVFIGQGQMLSQPTLLGLVTAALNPQADEDVLVIGAGSGYQSAVLSHLARQVDAYEIDPVLAQRAERTIQHLEIENLNLVAGDGTDLPVGKIYRKIAVLAGSPSVPDFLAAHLAEGGTLTVPVYTHEDAATGQKIYALKLFTQQDGALKELETLVEDTHFVPLRGAAGWPARSEVRDASTRRPTRQFVPPARAEVRSAATRHDVDGVGSEQPLPLQVIEDEHDYEVEHNLAQLKAARAKRIRWGETLKRWSLPTSASLFLGLLALPVFGVLTWTAGLNLVLFAETAGGLAYVLGRVFARYPSSNEVKLMNFLKLRAPKAFEKSERGYSWRETERYLKPQEEQHPDSWAGGRFFREEPRHDSLSESDKENLHTQELLHYLDRSLTQLGYARLKRLFNAPLLDAAEIKMRQEASRFLVRERGLREYLREALPQVNMPQVVHYLQPDFFGEIPAKSLKRSIILMVLWALGIWGIALSVYSSAHFSHFALFPGFIALIASIKALNPFLEAKATFESLRRAESVARRLEKIPQEQRPAALNEILEVLSALWRADHPHSISKEIHRPGFILKKWIRLLTQKGDELQRIAGALSELEVYAAMGQMAVDFKWNFPEVLDQAEPYLEIKDGIYPLYYKNKGLVANSAKLSRDGDQIYLITGPYESGKSTFVRMIGQLVLLSQIGAPVPGTVKLSPMKIRTHVRVNDSPSEGISRFRMEGRTMGDLVRAVAADPKTLVIADEMFEGSVSADKTVGQQAAIIYFQQLGALGVIATHDVFSAEALNGERGIKNLNFKGIAQGAEHNHKLLGGITEPDPAVMRAVMEKEGFPEAFLAIVDRILARDTPSRSEMRQASQSKMDSLNFLTASTSTATSLASDGMTAQTAPSTQVKPVSFLDPRDWPAVKSVDMALGFEPGVLYQTAVGAAGTAGPVFPLLAGVWTSGIGPVTPAYSRFLVSLTQSVTDKTLVRLARVSTFDLIAPKAAQQVDPIVAVHTFKTMPGMNDPEISVWADFLARQRQAYLTIEVPDATPAMRRSLEAALQKLILQKRSEAGLKFTGANVKVVQAGDFQTAAASASVLIYGRDRRRLKQLSAQAERSGRKQRLMVADDLNEKNRKALDRAGALLSALDALLSSEMKYSAGIVNVSQLMGERIGLVHQLQKLVELSA